MVLEKVNQEEFWQMSQEEMFERLKETYQKQKLGKVGRYFSRLSSAFLLLLFAFFGDEIFYQVIAGIGAIYEIYRLIKPHGEDEEQYKEFKIISNLVQEYKDKILNTSDEKPRKTKIIYNYILSCLYRSANHKVSKAIAYIPVLNIMYDEMTPYTSLRYGVLLKAKSLLETEIDKIKK
jgi:hypothetical protein